MSTDERGLVLVSFARDVILHELGGPAPVRPSGPWFDAAGATFVTITRSGRLHGCIGSIAPHRSLVDDVEDNAIAAAFYDPRSTRFRAEWTADMSVEVTLLGPLSPIYFVDEASLIEQLVPRVDGLVLRWRAHRGTFLPQVWESLPEPRAFLAELKIKAGLPRDFWAEEVEVSRFAVQKWGDRQRRMAPRARTEAPS